MTLAQFEIQLMASVVAVACALSGVFLVLRRMSMISDAIGHSILPGLVLGFFITQNLNSPLLILMAALTGILTVIAVEAIQKTDLVKEDTAIGLVFPALFSIGIIMISKYAKDVHLDVDAVLLGELAFAPFDRWFIGDINMGPKALWVMGVILMITISLLILFYKELKVSTFDPGLSAALGISPAVIHYALMSVSSVTIVGAFDAVGAILVVALMIVPAAAAYLLTNDLKKMLILSAAFGIFSAISGYWLANILNASISGSMATMLGLLFLMVYLFAPGRGLFAHFFKQRRQKSEVMLLTFLLHLHSLDAANDLEERKIAHLNFHFNWNNKQAKNILSLGKDNDLISVDKDLVHLTDKGTAFTTKAIEYILTNRDEKIEHIKKDFLLFRG